MNTVGGREGGSEGMKERMIRQKLRKEKGKKQENKEKVDGWKEGRFYGRKKRPLGGHTGQWKFMPMIGIIHECFEQ